MPAAETACVPPGDPDDPNDGPHAPIIHLADRAERTRRRRRHATARPSGPAAPELSDDPQQRIGQQTEALFNSRDRTLADDDTAESHIITMEGVLSGLNGALAKGIITPEQHATLKALYEGMRNAPHTL